MYNISLEDGESPWYHFYSSIPHGMNLTGYIRSAKFSRTNIYPPAITGGPVAA